MKTKHFILIFLFVLVKQSVGYAQVDPPRDSLIEGRIDTLKEIIKIDTSVDNSVNKVAAPARDYRNQGLLDTIPGKDSLVIREIPIWERKRLERMDSIPPSPSVSEGTINFADSGLEEEIDYEAEDSMRYDFVEEKIYLYGNAVVKYTTMTLEADFIIYEWTKNIATAEELPDSLRRPGGRPKFKDGSQDFEADKLRFNFKTRKGIVYDVRTKQGNDFIQSGKAKFITNGADTTESNEVFYGSDAIFTTCNHPEPHFGIRSKKQKIIPEKFVIVGPSNLEISGIPTPVWLPFGVFPLNKQKSTGLIFGDWDFSDQLGPGLRNTGWYFPMGDRLNLTLTGDFYTRGTFRIYVNADYRQRYKYTGNIRLSYNNDRVETPTGFFENQPAWGINWSHSQDAKAHPYNKFSGRIDMQTRNFNQRAFNNADQVLQTTYRSNVNYSRNFPNKPLFFSAAMSHSQDTRTRVFQLSLPVVDFRLNQIFPFKHKIKKAKERWYEKITFNYDMQAKNDFITTDTSIFTQKTLDDAKFGVRHTASTGANFPILKFFTINPRANYREVWDFRYINRFFNDDLQLDSLFEMRDGEQEFIGFDTLALGETITDTLRGFKPWRTYDLSVSLNTTIYGTRTFRKGLLRGIRHTIRPNVSFNFRPDFTDRDLGYFDDYIVNQLDGEMDTIQYSIFENGVYGSPPNSRRSMGISYGMTHLFEAKYFSKKDSTLKKLRLADLISINGNYNFVADSLNWSLVSFSTGAKFVKNLVTLRFTMSMDPYTLQEDDRGQLRRVNKFYLDTNNKLLRLERAELRLSTGFTLGRLKDTFSKNKKQGESSSNRQATSTSNRPGARPAALNKPPETLFDYFKDFRISYNFTLLRENNTRADTLRVSVHNIRLTGNMQLSEKWAISIGNISYDFPQKRLVFPDLGFTRDLHCWEMSMNWQPTRNAYTFSIRTKPGTLDFLKVPYQKNQFDGF